MEEQKNYLEQYAGQGFENVSGGDCQVPFLRILQSLSPQCDKNESDVYVENAEPGLFMNSVTNRLYGKVLNIVPVDYKKVWVEWKPKRGGFVGMHEPNSISVNKENFTEWKSLNGNIIVETYTFYCILPDFPEDGLIIFPLSISGVRHAKNWNSQITHVKLPNGKAAPYFSSVWEIRSVYNKNEKGTFFTIGTPTTTGIKRVRYITQKELNNQVLSAKALIKDIVIDYAQIDSGIKNEQDLLTNNIQY